MKHFYTLPLAAALVVPSFWAISSHSASLEIDQFSASGQLNVTNTFLNGVVTIEQADAVTGPWIPVKNAFSSSSTTELKVETSSPGPAFYRALAVDLAPDLPNGRSAFTNLVESYGLITTIAGAGGVPTKGVNKWLPLFEGGPATGAQLSRPHIALGDSQGNIIITDKDAHAVRKVTPDGLIFTIAGTSASGNGPDTPTVATNSALSGPNGLWIAQDDTIYILDSFNGKIRKMDTNGMMSTLITDPGGITVGRGLWVSEDETLVYYCSATVLKKWTPTSGIEDFATGFAELGYIAMSPSGELAVTDRNSHRVWRYQSDGSGVIMAGNGLTAGGGDGFPATQTGLNEVRGVWYLPTGAYLLATHRGSQVWYVDLAGTIHLLVNGNRGNTFPIGDGTWFYSPLEQRLSEPRSVTMDRAGNILITENDSGYVRKIEFIRHDPN